MEFSERRRSRKSQSYKLVNEDYHSEVYKSQDYSDINGESIDFHHFSGVEDEGMEIKKQITGMRRLLNDSTGRVYQRVGKEGEKLKEGVHDLDISWNDSLSTSCAADDPIHSTQASWNNVPIQTSEFSGQYGTRSKTVQNQLKNPGTNGELRMVNSVSESKCCTCNCQPTLQAILQELKAMRKFMQVQAVAQTRQQTAQSCLCSQKTVLSRKRIMKKKVLPKNTTVTSVHSTSAREHKPLLLPDKSSGVSQAEHVKKEDDHVAGYGIVVDSSSSDPDVQLAEGFDVFMAKSQLDSILSNYKRSGSLLFRKLVCAFFDDKTLATSLPNGKRKRGLNDNRQGLDQNIVGAIKVFTEKYCTANNVEKVPGPRHWVQILQDQIKLARRRLKRGCDLGNSLQTTDDEMWLHSKAGF